MVPNQWELLSWTFLCTMLVTTQIHTRIFTNPNILKEDISVQNQKISETEATYNCVDHAHKSLACETAATFPPWSLRENQIKTHTLKAISAAHPRWKLSSRGCVILYRKLLNVTQERELKLMQLIVNCYASLPSPLTFSVIHWYYWISVSLSLEKYQESAKMVEWLNSWDHERNFIKGLHMV